MADKGELIGARKWKRKIEGQNKDQERNDYCKRKPGSEEKSLQW